MDNFPNTSKVDKLYESIFSLSEDILKTHCQLSCNHNKWGPVIIKKMANDNRLFHERKGVLNLSIVRIVRIINIKNNKKLYFPSNPIAIETPSNRKSRGLWLSEILRM